MNRVLRYFKKRSVKKNLIRLRQLLVERYGKSKYYTKAQIDRTAAGADINEQCLWYAYVFYLDPKMVSGIILPDVGPYSSHEALIAEMGVLFGVKGADGVIEHVQCELNSAPGFSGVDGVGDAGVDSSDLDP